MSKFSEDDSTIVKDTVQMTFNEFKRTHQDDWETHRLQFTPDQLEAFTDAVAPPSYLA